LTGYLLPWDQRAYWATVVTIQMAQSAPLAGKFLAALMRGGAEIGALTLSRWYAVHVIFLPGALIALVVLHLFLMRRHGISGPLRPRAGVPHPFFPDHAIRDVAVVAAVAAAVVLLALNGMPPLERVADPSDATYVPRPEWYFLGLFQLLKYFPGRLEVIAAIVIPAAAVAFLLALPWLDRGPERHPLRRPIVGVVAAGTAALVVLTVLGMADSPGGERRDASRWSERQLAGRIITSEANCARCHSTSGIADPLPQQAIVRGPDWLEGHVADPEVIAPGLRPAPEINPLDVAAILAYLERAKEGPTPVLPDQRTRTAAVVFARYCIVCHTVEADGGTDGPDLTRIGQNRDAAWLKQWITDPAEMNEDAEMPAFGDKLSEEELTAIASHLAAKK
jgi:ubiquinol-cytochrome c reductase cytochrome b subunit